MPDVNEIEIRFTDNAPTSQARVDALYQSTTVGGKQATQAVDAFGQAFSRIPGPIGQAAGALQSLNGSSLASVAGVGALATGIVGLGAALIKITGDTADYVTKVTVLSDRLGLSTESVSKFAMAADDASVAVRGQGIEIDQVASGLERFQSMLGRGMNALEGMGAGGAVVVQSFKALGVDMQAASREGADVFEVLGQIADGMAQIGDRSQQAAIAKRLGLTDLLPLLRDGRSAMDAYIAGARDARVVTGELAEEVKKLRQAQDEYDDSLKATEISLGRALLPTMKSVTEWAGKSASQTVLLQEAQQALADMDAMSLAGAKAGKAAADIEGFAAAQIKAGEAVARYNESLRPGDQLLSRLTVSTGAAREALAAYDAVRQRNIATTITAYSTEMQYGAAMVSVATSSMPAMFQSAMMVGDALRDLDAEQRALATGWDQNVGAMGKKGEADLKLIEDAARKAKTEIDGLAGSFRQKWEPPTGQEKAGQIFSLATGQTDVGEFEKGQVTSMLGTLAGQGKITPQQVGELGRTIKDYGLNSAETFRTIATTSPAAQSALAQFAKTIRDIETSAGVMGGVGELGKYVQTGTRTVGPSKDAQLDAREAAIAADNAKGALDKAKFSEPLLPGMFPNEWTPEKAKQNTEAASIAYERAMERMEAAAKRAQPALQTTYSFTEPFFNPPAGIDKYSDGKGGTANNPEAGPGAAGADLGSGIGSGFASQAEPLAQTMTQTIDAALAAVRERYRMQSPSGYTADNIGEPLAQGIALGLERGAAIVHMSITSMVSDSVVSVTNTETLGMWYSAGESWGFAVADGIKSGQKRIEKAFQDAVRASMGFLISEMVEEIRRRLR